MVGRAGPTDNGCAGLPAAASTGTSTLIPPASCWSHPLQYPKRVSGRAPQRIVGERESPEPSSHSVGAAEGQRPQSTDLSPRGPQTSGRREKRDDGYAQLGEGAWSR